MSTNDAEEFLNFLDTQITGTVVAPIRVGALVDLYSFNTHVFTTCGLCGEVSTKVDVVSVLQLSGSSETVQSFMNTVLGRRVHSTIADFSCRSATCNGSYRLSTQVRETASADLPAVLLVKPAADRGMHLEEVLRCGDREYALTSFIQHIARPAHYIAYVRTRTPDLRDVSPVWTMFDDDRGRPPLTRAEFRRARSPFDMGVSGRRVTPNLAVYEELPTLPGSRSTDENEASRREAAKTDTEHDALRRAKSAGQRRPRNLILAGERQHLDECLYARLGVQVGAGVAAVRRAYYALARVYHPDKTPHGNKVRFIAFHAAYEVLSDEHSRVAYDAGDSWCDEGGVGERDNGTRPVPVYEDWWDRVDPPTAEETDLQSAAAYEPMQGDSNSDSSSESVTDEEAEAACVARDELDAMDPRNIVVGTRAAAAFTMPRPMVLDDEAAGLGGDGPSTRSRDSDTVHDMDTTVAVPPPGSAGAPRVLGGPPVGAVLRAYVGKGAGSRAVGGKPVLVLCEFPDGTAWRVVLHRSVDSSPASSKKGALCGPCVYVTVDETTTHTTGGGAAASLDLHVAYTGPRTPLDLGPSLARYDGVQDALRVAQGQKYAVSTRGKQCARKYEASTRGKERAREYAASTRGKERKQMYAASTRGKVSARTCNERCRASEDGKNGSGARSEPTRERTFPCAVEHPLYTPPPVSAEQQGLGLDAFRALSTDACFEGVVCALCEHRVDSFEAIAKRVTAELRLPRADAPAGASTRDTASTATGCAEDPTRYEVTAILDKRITGGANPMVEYLVAWKGGRYQHARSNTWEPGAELQRHAARLVDKYEDGITPRPFTTYTVSTIEERLAQCPLKRRVWLASPHTPDGQRGTPRTSFCGLELCPQSMLPTSECSAHGDLSTFASEDAMRRTVQLAVCNKCCDSWLDLKGAKVVPSPVRHSGRAICYGNNRAQQVLDGCGYSFDDGHALFGAAALIAHLRALPTDTLLGAVRDHKIVTGDECVDGELASRCGARGDLILLVARHVAKKLTATSMRDVRQSKRDGLGGLLPPTVGRRAAASASPPTGTTRGSTADTLNSMDTDHLDAYVRFMSSAYGCRYNADLLALPALTFLEASWLGGCHHYNPHVFYKLTGRNSQSYYDPVTRKTRRVGRSVSQGNMCVYRHRVGPVSERGAFVDFGALGEKVRLLFVGSRRSFESVRANLRLFKPDREDIPIMRKNVLLKHIEFYKFYGVEGAPFMSECTCVQGSTQQCPLCTSVANSDQIPTHDIPDWVVDRMVFEESNTDEICRSADAHGARFTETNHVGQAGLRATYGAASFDLRKGEVVFLQRGCEPSRWVRATVKARVCEGPVPLVDVVIADDVTVTLLACAEGGDRLCDNLAMFEVSTNDGGLALRGRLCGVGAEVHSRAAPDVSVGAEVFLRTAPDGHETPYVVRRVFAGASVHGASPVSDGSREGGRGLADRFGSCTALEVLCLARQDETPWSPAATVPPWDRGGPKGVPRADIKFVVVCGSANGDGVDACGWTRCVELGAAFIRNEPGNAIATEPPTDTAKVTDVRLVLECPVALVKRQGHFLVAVDGTGEVNDTVLGFDGGLAAGLHKLNVEGAPPSTSSDPDGLFLHPYNTSVPPVNEWDDPASFVALHLDLHPVFRGGFGVRVPATWLSVKRAIAVRDSLAFAHPDKPAVFDQLARDANKWLKYHGHELIPVAPFQLGPRTDVVGSLARHVADLLASYGYQESKWPFVRLPLA